MDIDETLCSIKMGDCKVISSLGYIEPRIGINEKDIALL